MMREMVRDFTEKEIAPKAAELDKSCEFPFEHLKKMAELNLLGIPIPEEYGGAGMDVLAYAICIEEVARACAATALTLAAQTSLATVPILKFGSDDQKNTYLAKLCSGEYIGAFALTEPEAGSDASATKTTAHLENGHYNVNGSKIFVTNGGHAQVVVFTAKTSDEPGSRGISSFIVEKGTAGFAAGKDEKKLGVRASQTSQLFFENCKIPQENLLGAEGDGFKNFLWTLDGGRCGIGAMALGIAQGALDVTLKYAKERFQFGVSIASFQAIQEMFADMATEIEAARHLVYNASYLRSKGERVTKEAAMAKLFASEMAMRVTYKAIQIHGGYGYTKDFPVERMCRDAKVCEIGEGTSEIQRMVIAREIIGEL